MPTSRVHITEFAVIFAEFAVIFAAIKIIALIPSIPFYNFDKTAVTKKAHFQDHWEKNAEKEELYFVLIFETAPIGTLQTQISRNISNQKWLVAVNGS